MAWTTSIVLGPGEKHPWRFLGGRREAETQRAEEEEPCDLAAETGCRYLGDQRSDVLTRANIRTEYPQESQEGTQCPFRNFP